MKKDRIYQLDFGLQSLIMVFFIVCSITGNIAPFSAALMCMLALGAWQLLSAAVWGLVFADYQRGQFFFVAVLAAAGFSVLASLPEYQDAELLFWVAKFLALVMMVFYYKRSFDDFHKTLPKESLI